MRNGVGEATGGTWPTYSTGRGWRRRRRRGGRLRSGREKEKEKVEEEEEEEEGEDKEAWRIKKKPGRCSWDGAKGTGSVEARVERRNRKKRRRDVR